MAKSFTIIGTGVTGTAVLIEFTRHLVTLSQKDRFPSNISITTIEKCATNGPGYPYNPNDGHPALLLNHPVLEMGIKTTDAKGKAVVSEFTSTKWRSYDFLHWLEENREQLAAQHPEMILATHPGESLSNWHPDPDRHYPRALFGLYMQERFTQTVQTLTTLGVSVRNYNNTEATELRRRGKQLVLSLKDIAAGNTHTVHTDKLLLATGRWAKEPLRKFRSPHYFHSLFPTRTLLQTIKPAQPGLSGTKHIIIEGTGLTGADAILTLATGQFERRRDDTLHYLAGKHPARITAVSRSGLLPVVRGFPKTLPTLRYFTPQKLAAIKKRHGSLVLAELATLFQQELDAQLGHPVDLQAYFLPAISAKEKLTLDIARAKKGNVVYAVCRLIASLRLFSQLSPQDRAFFLHTLKSLYLQNVAALPMVNAEKLLALFEAGVLDIIKLGDEKTALRTHGSHLILEYGRHQLQADYIINAVGDELDIEKNTDPLITSLLTSGEVVASQEPTPGGALVNTGGIKITDNYTVISEHKSAHEASSPDISAIGMLVNNWLVEKSFASASVEAAKIVAHNWIRSLT